MIAASSALVIIQPQVNRTVRRGEDIDSRCLISSWLAPAPLTRIRIFRRNRGRDLADPRGQHVQVVIERAGVPLSADGPADNAMPGGTVGNKLMRLAARARLAGAGAEFEFRTAVRRFAELVCDWERSRQG
jgi:hypothetical protein